MAAASMEEQLICPIHLGLLEEPKTLPCQHWVCLTCLQKWVEKNEQFVCPECRQSFVKPPGGLSALPSNFKVQQMCERLKLGKQDPHAFNGELAKCPNHDGETLSHICCDCFKFVCQECVFADHKSHCCPVVWKAWKYLETQFSERLSKIQEENVLVEKNLEDLIKRRTKMEVSKTESLSKMRSKAHELISSVQKLEVKNEKALERQYQRAISKDNLQMEKIIKNQDKSQKTSKSAEILKQLFSGKSAREVTKAHMNHFNNFRFSHVFQFALQPMEMYVIEEPKAVDVEDLIGRLVKVRWEQDGIETNPNPIERKSKKICSNKGNSNRTHKAKAVESSKFYAPTFTFKLDLNDTSSSGAEDENLVEQRDRLVSSIKKMLGSLQRVSLTAKLAAGNLRVVHFLKEG